MNTWKVYSVCAHRLIDSFICDITQKIQILIFLHNAFVNSSQTSLSEKKETYINLLQFVVVNGAKSQSSNVKYGVPQGSVLGPLLFLIYINDIINSSQLFTYSLFADDTCLLYSHKNIHTLMQSVNTEICKLFAWFCSNKLLLNTGKTKCVLFRSRGRKIPNSVSPLVVGGQQINRSQHVQFLGVTVDGKFIMERTSW